MDISTKVDTKTVENIYVHRVHVEGKRIQQQFEMEVNRMVQQQMQSKQDEIKEMVVKFRYGVCIFV